ncbi:hypothetical protein [Mycobacteroides abscessus]|uniref:hypothetical protein n=1 Tax=Mycobacteroides abscessus TaxID=36809 RepID=UPI000926480E|nr:hypothetical protein [Mycobacteroides abscessus]SIB69179.1 Uncharacterised protein [Mycobacteroides abscessus subsp. abscessus]
MREVTIEGTETPAAGVLARGKRATVAYTSRIARLISFGYVRIVSGPTSVEDDEAAPVEAPADPEVGSASADEEQDGGPDPEPGDPQIETTTHPKAPRSRGPRT